MNFFFSAKNYGTPGRPKSFFICVLEAFHTEIAYVAYLELDLYPEESLRVRCVCVCVCLHVHTCVHTGVIK